MSKLLAKYYRSPWDFEKVEYLKKWWPHFGTYHCADVLGLTRQQVKSKVNKMRLITLPKTERICLGCRLSFQKSRNYGLLCSECFLSKRKEDRRNKPRTLLQWIGEATNMVRCRSKEPSDLSTEYMVDLWEQQCGRCHYSGLEMIKPTYGSGRSPYSPSIDRIDSTRGYVKGNVVWATWICNAGKNDLSVADYLHICRTVVSHLENTEHPYTTPNFPE